MENDVDVPSEYNFIISLICDTLRSILLQSEMYQLKLTKLEPSNCHLRSGDGGNRDCAPKVFNEVGLYAYVVAALFHVISLETRNPNNNVSGDYEGETRKASAQMLD